MNSARRVLVAFAVVVVGAVALSWPSAVAAATEGACVDSSGVTVVVDFRELGGGIVVRCAGAGSRDGFDALARAGFSARTAIRSPGFVCRIDNKPTSDACIDAAPASAYWSYWLASRGGAWCYASLGAGNRTPVSGTVEGWSFALDKTASALPAPGIAVPPASGNGSVGSLGAADCDRSASPPVTAAPPSPTTLATTPTVPRGAISGGRPSPTPSTSPSTSSPGAAPSTSRAPKGTAIDPATPGGPPPGGTSPAGEPTPDAAAEPPATPGAGVSTTAGSLDSLPPIATTASSAPPPADDGGSPVGTIVAVLAIVGLCVASIVRARRPRARPL